jgi:hypothetical protein
VRNRTQAAARFNQALMQSSAIGSGDNPAH